MADVYVNMNGWDKTVLLKDVLTIVCHLYLPSTVILLLTLLLLALVRMEDAFRMEYVIATLDIME
jgi:hypothetical protein